MMMSVVVTGVVVHDMLHPLVFMSADVGPREKKGDDGADEHQRDRHGDARVWVMLGPDLGQVNPKERDDGEDADPKRHVHCYDGSGHCERGC